MSGAKITPGPWTVEPAKGHAGGYHIKGPSIGGRFGIFFPTIATDLTYEDAQQRKRDAQAIAALPDLVAALKPFAGYIGKSGDPVTLKIGDATWTHSLTTDDFERAREALRKAGLL